jgi:hypothetical protein
VNVSALSVVNVQSWPGRDGLRERVRRRRPYDRLGDRSGIVFAAAAERYVADDHFGLGAYLLIGGPGGRSVFGAGLVLPDDRPELAAELAGFLAQHAVDTPAGPKQWRCHTLREFFDYKTGVFTKRVYEGAGWLVTADLGRTLGLIAEAWTPARATGRSAFWRGGFKLYPPTWSKLDTRKEHEGRLDSVSPHRPALRVKPAGAHGWIAQFARAPGGKGAGKRNPDGSPYRGRFLDVVQLAHMLDGIDSSELGGHLEAFGFENLELPAAMIPDEQGAATMLRLVTGVHALALTLDEEATRWLTTPDDRARGLGRIDLCGLVSPAGLASAIVHKSGVRPPLLKFPKLADEDLKAWMAAHRGGWLSAELAGDSPFPAVDIDVHSAYPVLASLLGWWRLMTAARLRRQDKTDALRALCVEAAAGNVSRLLDSQTWRRFGFTLCEVVCQGETWPVESPDGDYPEGHSAMRPVRSSMPLSFTWPDVVLAALLSGRVPKILSAVQLVPIGRQEGLRTVYPLYGGRILGIDDDPAVALVRLRDRAKETGDMRLAAQLRVVVNSLVYGNPVRLDQIRHGTSRCPELTEQPAEWTFPPIAVTVTSASRLLLGITEHLLTPYGIAVASRDTDGLLLRCAADQWAVLDGVLARFESLNLLGDGSFFWKAEREKDGRPLHGLVIAVKRYALFTLDDSRDVLEVVEATEHALGGAVVDPPLLVGRDATRHHRWTRKVAEFAVRQALVSSKGRELLAPAWPWEQRDGPFPCMQREQVVSRERLMALHRRSVSVHPFGYVVVGVTECSSSISPAALDPGTDLAEWCSLDWRGGNGEPVQVSVDRSDLRAVLLANLGSRAWRWLQPRLLDDRRLVEVGLVLPVGKAGPLLEAALLPGEDASGLRAVYDDEGRAREHLRGLVNALGPRAFARRAGISRKASQRLKDDKVVRATTMRLALRNLQMCTPKTRRCPVDNEPVFRSRATYCSGRCKATARKRRQRAGSLHEQA